ncbi:MAG TPA: molecular chaperone TorD family protein [Aggregatilinea sp.]|uniref:TorD/DmsD family molecular chaperone n=1 Tax=Aggregatilinea sp. TaxID=2806333 RepID=UPI002C728DFF|nr:molecular chaperone TorD family protein [Aggregatilinea sp.]HML20878.1 molecular chaperone TorD family protein [Aggregatilinea sp.]
MEAQKLLEQLSTEVFFFNLMGKLLQTPPGKATLAWFQMLADEDIFDDVLFGGTQPDIVEGAAKIDAWLKSTLAADPPAAIERLNIDYGRLFVGPGEPVSPPWESFYFNVQGLLFQAQTMQVREWFRRFNLESEKIHNEPDDHIGLEFSFMGYLAALAVAALERNDLGDAQALIQAQRDFFVEHPSQWMDIWCDQVLQRAQTEFYMGVALLVRGAVKELAAIHQITESTM